MNAFIHYVPGVWVMHGGERYVITHNLNLEKVLAKHSETGQLEELAIRDLSPASDEKKTKQRLKGQEIALIDAEKWNNAKEWSDRLTPLLETTNSVHEKAQSLALTTGVHQATVYRKLKTLKTIGKVTALVQESPSGGRGKSRISEESEVVIQQTISEFYFNKEQKKRTKYETYEEIEGKLKNAGIAVPSQKTIYNRINEAIRKKEKGATKPFDPENHDETPIPNKIPGADYPLAIVQIDHTPIDMNVVDDENRESIGRPWITVLIDVFSRMIIGFYLSLDPPNNMSVGEAITNAILRKEDNLARFNITASYPCWGVMDIIHADNAGEFRGEMIRRACNEYSIDIEWRPVKTPRYGAHIERYLGGLMKRIHRLNGTTFSNVEEKGNYDSEKYADMTLDELEAWITNFIVGVYHRKRHRTLRQSPISRYEAGILGNEKMPGRGLPRAVQDGERLKLDLMPLERRSIQDSKVVIDHIWYSAGVLDRYKHSYEPANPTKRMKFIFKRDPRNISVIYFYDPELKEYFRVPYNDTSHPAISIWEHKKIIRRLKEDGVEDINETVIFEHYQKMQKIQEESATKTKTARREAQRRKYNEKVLPPKTADESYEITNEIYGESGDEEFEILPYDDIDMLD
jgi:putative transposase